MKIDFSACFVTDSGGLRQRIESASENYSPLSESYFHEILKRRNEAFYESACGFLLLDGLFVKNKIDRADLIIDYNGKKRPYILNDESIDFSISHSEGCAFCVLAISQNGETAGVGCDVQFARNYSAEKMAELANAFMNDRELSEFNNSADKPASFFTAWTRREAYIKRAGLDIFGSFKNADLSDGDFTGSVIRASGKDYYYSISVPSGSLDAETDEEETQIEEKI